MYMYRYNVSFARFFFSFFSGSIKTSTVPSIPSGNVTKDDHNFLNDEFTVESEAGLFNVFHEIIPET